MYNNGNGKHHVSDEERAAFKEALTIYYSGKCRMVDAFAQVEPGLIDRYYRRKKKHPDEIERIDSEVRATVREERSSEQFAHEAWQWNASVDVQQLVGEHIKEVIDELLSIVRGEAKVIHIEETGETKVTIPYPRDRINAARLLLDIARNGLLPKGFQPSSVSDVQKERGYEAVSRLDLIGVNPNFTTISAMKPNGELITATVDDEEFRESDH
jgi:hypothetical protein